VTKPSSNPSQYLSPRIVQSIGVVGMIMFAVFWAFTGRVSVELLSVFGGMLTFGGVLQAREDGKKLPPGDGSS
jgi:hypothetical protein